MKIGYRRDSIIITVGPPHLGKTELLRGKFPAGSVLSLEDISVSLSGIQRTVDSYCPLPRKKEELAIMIEFIKARAVQGLLTVIIGVRSPALLEAITSIANEYSRPVWYLLFDSSDKDIIEANSSGKVKYRFQNDDLATMIANARSVADYITKTYPRSYDTITKRNRNFKPVIRMTDHVYNENNFMVIGDLHGDISAYKHFKAQADKYGARMFTCGDLIDYGDSSVSLLDVALKECVNVRGNHEKNLVNIREKGADMASLATSYTYKQLLLRGTHNIEYYINALKRLPLLIEIHAFGKKYILSHYTFTMDTLQDGSYQFRDQEVTGATYFNYGDGEKAIIPKEYINIYGHLTTGNPAPNQVCINCLLDKNGGTFRSALVTERGIKILEYKSSVVPSHAYPINKGVDDVNMFPVLGFMNANRESLQLTPVNGSPRYSYAKHASLPNGCVYDKLLRCFVTAGSNDKVSYGNVRLQADPSDGIVLHEIRTFKPENTACVTLLPERELLVSGCTIHNISSRINLNQMFRNMRPGTSIYLYEDASGNVAYAGYGYLSYDTVPDVTNACQFNTKTALLSCLRDAGVVIPKYYVFKDMNEQFNDTVKTLRGMWCFQNNGIRNIFLGGNAI